jgi:mannose-6-phosphate isomerase-like protein (cupin superfamily)
MRLLGELPARTIEHFGSAGFRHTRVARGDLQVSIAELDGVIGGHDAASQQILVVLAGRVAVATRTGAAELGPSEAVEWQEGEWHETRSLEPSTLLLIEGTLAA